MRSNMRSERTASARAARWYRGPDSDTRIVTVRSGSKPASTSSTRMKLRTSRPGADEQHQRKRDLDDDERRSGALAARRRSGSSSFLQRVRSPRTGGAERRDEAEHDSADEGGQQRESEHPAVDANQFEPLNRQPLGDDDAQQVERPPREQQPGEPSHAGEHQGFREKLTHQPCAAGAQRGADRELPLARGRACEQEVRHVRAGDQQDEADGAEHDVERHPDIAGELLAQRDDPRRPARVEVREPSGELLVHARHVALRLFERHALLRASDRHHPAPARRARLRARIPTGIHRSTVLSRNENPGGITPTTA